MRPTIKSLQDEIATLRAEAVLLRAYRGEKNRLEERVKELEQDILSRDGVSQSLNYQLSNMADRFRARLDFFAKLRRTRADFSNAIAVSAPVEIIEKHRERMFDVMAELATMEMREATLEEYENQNRPYADAFQRAGSFVVAPKTRYGL